MDFTLTPKVKTTDRTKEDLLKGHMEVSREYWDELIPGMQVRYEGKDGKMRVGGFVVAIIETKDPETGNPEKTMRLSNIPKRYAKGKKDYVEFNVRFNTINKLWKAIDKFSYFELTRVQNILRSIKDRMDTMEDRISLLEKRK